MKLSISDIPLVFEQEQFSGSVRLVPETIPDVSREINEVINSVTMSVVDDGLTLDYTTDPTALSLSGRYTKQFDNVISYNKPQVDDFTKPESVTVKGWGSMPAGGVEDPEFWFLYKWQPPSKTSVTVTFTLDVSYDIEDITPPPVVPGAKSKMVVVKNKITHVDSKILTVTQGVRFDADTNLSEFKRWT